MTTAINRRAPVLELLNWAADFLTRQGVDSARHEAEVLLSTLLECARIGLYLERERTASPAEAELFREQIIRRAEGMPLQYLTKEAYFFGLKFYIDEGVFIPRPETEVLAEYCIDVLRTRSWNSLRVLELCVGSGALSITLTKHAPACTIVATDCDDRALLLAGKNALLHGVAERITLLRGDLFGALTGDFADARFDLIVANPPYIAGNELEGLPPDVRREPRTALDGGKDGLKFYRDILRECGKFLHDQGTIAFECGDTQHTAICEMIGSSGIFESPSVFPDLNGIYRFVSARRKNG